jgi:hypothetical protein
MVEVAFGHSATAMVAVLAQLVTQIEQWERELNAHFERHPDAEILLSQLQVRLRQRRFTATTETVEVPRAARR